MSYCYDAHLQSHHFLLTDTNLSIRRSTAVSSYSSFSCIVAKYHVKSYFTNTAPYKAAARRCDRHCLILIAFRRPRNDKSHFGNFQRALLRNRFGIVMALLMC